MTGNILGRLPVPRDDRRSQLGREDTGRRVSLSVSYSEPHEGNSGNGKIARLRAILSGETRTRTGDTTIFSRAAATLERARKACKYA
jgi:hypothetical protein